MTKEQQQQIKEGYLKNEEKLWNLYDKCYGDDSNDLFDELHDELLYQIRGAGMTLEEGDISLGEAREFAAMVGDIEDYYKTVTKAPQIEWVYG